MTGGGLGYWWRLHNCHYDY